MENGKMFPKNYVCRAVSFSVLLPYTATRTYSVRPVSDYACARRTY